MSRFIDGGGILEVGRQPANGNGNAGTPTPGDRTDRQRPLSWGYGAGAIGGTGIGLGGPGAAGIGLGFDGATTGPTWAAHPFFGQMFAPTYATYRLMRTQPTLALLRSLVMSPIIAAERVAEAVSSDEKPPEAWLRFARDRLVPVYRRSVEQMLFALDFGHSKFEKVWEIRDGYWGYQRLKPLAPEGNAILAYKDSGLFAGIRPAGAPQDGTGDLGPDKSYLVVYDGEAGDLRGRSRFENVRATAWAAWLEIVLSSAKLRKKLSGIIPIFYHPPGGFYDPPDSQNFVSYQDACRSAAAMLQNGEYLTIEHLGFRAEDIRNNPDLLQAGLVKVDFYDAGDYAPAQEGMIRALEYEDKNLSRGYLRPERSALEATTSGSRADSQQHTASGSEEGENLSASLDEQFNQQSTDEVMVLNFGEQARGKIRIRTLPLVDASVGIRANLLDKLIMNGLAQAVAETIDGDSVFKGLDIPTAKKWAEALAGVLQREQEKQKQQLEAKQQQPTGGPPRPGPGAPAAPGGGGGQ